MMGTSSPSVYPTHQHNVMSYPPPNQPPIIQRESFPPNPNFMPQNFIQSLSQTQLRPNTVVDENDNRLRERQVSEFVPNPNPMLQNNNLDL